MVYLAIDVGGTNTRAKFATIDKPGQSVLLRQKVTAKSELKEFITDIVGQKDVDRCAIGFGGPVVSRAEARMTNWPGGPVIGINDLADWGLPKGSTLMLNDMEAGAFGVISIREEGRSADSESVCLHEVEDAQSGVSSSNKILLAPGTGFGTIGIVSVKTKTGEYYETPVASEIQHSAALPLDPTHGALIDWLTEKGGTDQRPSWEEFVSGRGLVNIYDALAGISRITPLAASLHADDRAAWIAGNGVAGSDPGCEEALEIYYRCVGRAAQLLALAFQPFGGIYLSGESTIRNLSFILKSGFLSELQDNPTLGRLLERFPVYAITHRELNIRGALWACRERIHLSYGFH